MKKYKLKDLVSIGSHARKEVQANIVIGDGTSYAKGEILDANATSKLIDDKLAQLVGTAPENLNTIQEVSGAIQEINESIPTKMSDLTDDVGYVTESNGQLQTTSGNITNVISIISNQPFPSEWPTGSNKHVSDLVYAIDHDPDAIKGKVYLSTVHYEDLPGDLSDAELKVEIMDVAGTNSKIATFTITSANKSPYNWHATMWNGQIYGWHSYALA